MVDFQILGPSWKESEARAWVYYPDCQISLSLPIRMHPAKVSRLLDLRCGVDRRSAQTSLQVIPGRS